jgi:LysR family glycine cleavage system transcriptional activator
MSPQPPLESLRILAACVRHGNFSAAAAEIGITPTAVSQRMRNLEAQLGVRLFLRHGPRLTTTEAAQALGSEVARALKLISDAVDTARTRRLPLRVTCAPTFAARWLVPRLAQYHARPGASAIRLDTTQEILPPAQYDVAIRSSPNPPASGAYVRLMPDLGTPMLAPKFLPSDRTMTVDDLLELPLIPDPRWAEWFRLSGRPDARPTFIATRFPGYVLEAQAAAQGTGVALLSPALFGDGLAAPFSQVVSGRASYWLIWDEEPEPDFVSWLREEFPPIA